MAHTDPARLVHTLFTAYIILAFSTSWVSTGFRLTWVVILKLCQIIHVLIDDDPQVVCRLVCRNLALGERLRHDAGSEYMIQQLRQ